MAGMGGMPVARAWAGGTLVGKLGGAAELGRWHVTPVVATSVTRCRPWAGPALRRKPGAGRHGRHARHGHGRRGRSSAGFGAPRYGVKPIVMPKLTAV